MEKSRAWHEKRHADTTLGIDRMMGVEIELENVAFQSAGSREYLSINQVHPALPLTSAFLVVEDGSLRNNGLEFVSKIGMTGGQIITRLPELLNEEVFAGMPTVSPRTSVHVHINVLDLTFGQLKKMLLWYLLLEPVFFSLSGRRDKNIFCLPLLNSHFPIHMLFENYQARDFLYITGHKFRKYSALNLVPIGNIGTVEFRHHTGTCDPTVITNWMLFLYEFFESSIGDPNETTQSLYEKMVEANNKDALAELVVKSFGFGSLLQHDGLSLDYLSEHFHNLVTLLMNPEVCKSSDCSDIEVPNKKKSRKVSSFGNGVNEVMLDPSHWISAEPEQPVFQPWTHSPTAALATHTEFAHFTIGATNSTDEGGF